MMVGASFRPMLSVAVALLLNGLSVGHVATAQTARPTAAVESSRRPGLVARFRQANNQFDRLDLAVSLTGLPADVDPRLQNETPYRVRWQGALRAPTAGTYLLGVQVSGKVTIRLHETRVLEAMSGQTQWLVGQPQQLKAEDHPLTIEYESPSTGPAVLRLFWTGPKFAYEPIDERFLSQPPGQDPLTQDQQFQRGRDLVRVFRCQACHELPAEPPQLAAPDLRHLAGNIHTDWLFNRLAQHGTLDPDRRMPAYRLTLQEQEALVAYLLQDQNDRVPNPSTSRSPSNQPAPKKVTKSGKASQAKEPPSASRGRELALSLGCLTCHQLEGLGNQSPYSAGSLDQVAQKRPAEFFDTWLDDPKQYNPSHRMPRFTLSKEQRQDLALYLSSLGQPSPQKQVERTDERIAMGRKLFTRHRCNACHPSGDDPSAEQRQPWHPTPNWQESCLAEPVAGGRVGYGLSPQDRQAVITYLETRRHPAMGALAARQILRDHNCLACHRRNSTQGILAQVPRIIEKAPGLESRAAALVPPPLTSVGDKLRVTALETALRGQTPPRRNWLDVQMPKFSLTDHEAKQLVEAFVQADRIPEDVQPDPYRSHAERVAEFRVAGGRLLTTDGFGCMSCHQVGSQLPTQAPLNQRAPDLTGVAQRIRPQWFDRWVRNPIRIVPQMEMPSIQLPVRGVLEDDLDTQLAAVWHVLNLPDFQPPPTAPVKVARLSGVESRQERALIVTDVVRSRDKRWIKPLLVGFPNRQSFLFDLETVRLAAWTAGDTAQQRTEGKTWFWQLVGADLMRSTQPASDIQLAGENTRLNPLVRGQFPTELAWIQHRDKGAVEFEYRLEFELESTSQRVTLRETWTPLWNQDGRVGIARHIQVAHPLPAEWAIELRLAPRDAIEELDSDRLRLKGDFSPTVSIVSGHVVQSPTATARITPQTPLTLHYTSTIPVDQFPIIPPQPPRPAIRSLAIVPGFSAERLPFAASLMPTSLSWWRGQLVVTSLKGRVWLASDSDQDGLEDNLWAFSDELAAPFGASGNEDSLDVINKYALLRLYDQDQDGKVDRYETLASGWGHTADYHDWAIGLPRTAQGHYFVSLACQQDQRSEASARWRGTVLELIPGNPDPVSGHRYAIKPISAGHRFPIGIARNRDGDLFVTDNQGNYNPFNELNHVQAGKRYGFINAIEKKPGFKPPLTQPAIDIPHPWTRSVNGICFLESPRAHPPTGFGPFEGHLIGCEYDTRRLIRMSLQRVDGVLQGAAYPFSLEEASPQASLLGPLCCAVSPDGHLYVGGIRDSGWGGGNNIGEVVRLRLDHLPAGIAEVKALPRGLRVEFTKPLNSKLLAQRDGYHIESYTRVSTPAYGGPDQDRQREAIEMLRVDPRGRYVELQLPELKADYVYELTLDSALADDQELFPNTAFYTMRRVPREGR